jgi:hypothetical protein
VDVSAGGCDAVEWGLRVVAILSLGVEGRKASSRSEYVKCGHHLLTRLTLSVRQCIYSASVPSQACTSLCLSSVWPRSLFLHPPLTTTLSMKRIYFLAVTLLYAPVLPGRTRILPHSLGRVPSPSHGDAYGDQLFCGMFQDFK